MACARGASSAVSDVVGSLGAGGALTRFNTRRAAPLPLVFGLGAGSRYQRARWCVKVCSLLEADVHAPVGGCHVLSRPFLSHPFLFRLLTCRPVLP